MATTDRLGTSVDPSLGYKAPVRVASTANVVLTGLQTIDGIVLAEGDRVLLKNQTDQTTNGIWNASTGDWTRAVDADGSDELVNGMQVAVARGSANANSIYFLTTVDPIVLGTSLLTFQNFNANLPASRTIATTSPLAGGGDLTANRTLSINANGITYGLIQQVAASSLVGNPTGVLATVAAIALGATLAFSGATLQTAALSGDVTSSANSFVTTIGAGAVSLSKMANLAANSFIGNNTGSSAQPIAMTVSQAQSLLGCALLTANTFTAKQTVALDDSATAAISTLLQLTHTSSGTVAAAFGAQMSWNLESAAGTSRNAMTNAVSWTDATDAAEYARYTISLMIGGTLQRVALFDPKNTNLALSQNSGANITTGIKNLLLGYNSGNALTSANENVLVGNDAGNALTTATYNVMVGQGCGSGVVTGASNTIAGAYAMAFGSGAKTGNSVFGYSSCTGMTAANYNSALGANTGLALTSGGYNIVIGAWCDVPSATASGQLNIGNLIQGTGVYATGSASSALVSGVLTIGSTTIVKWDNGSGTPDLGLTRNAAGILEVNSGTAATLRDLTMRYLGLNKAPASSAFLSIDAGTTARAQINLAASTAPTSPNNGDVWFDGTNLKIQVGGATKTVTIT